MAWKWKYSPNEQLEDRNTRHPGLTGLQNLENTCYMNAVLQCLCSLTPLVQYFLSGGWNSALHEWVGLFTPLLSFLLATVFLPKDMCCHGNVQGTCQLPQVVPVTLATSWFPSPLTALCFMAGWFSTILFCHSGGNTLYCCHNDDSYHFLGSAESLKPSDSCQSCTVPASVFCIVLPFEGRHNVFELHLNLSPFFQGRLARLRLPLAVWCRICGLESLSMFPLRLFIPSLGSGTQLSAGGLSTMHKSSSSVCWMTSTRLSRRWEPSCGVLGTTGVCFLCISWLRIPCNNCLSSSSELHDGATNNLLPLFHIYVHTIINLLLV